MRRLPDFLIAGTMKSGTSSLAHWLGARPDVHLAPGKEIHFFDDEENFARGPEWYARQLAAPPQAALAFEATPLYSSHPEAVHRMSALLPEVKVIMCLRDPVTRAYSHYHHIRGRRGTEHRSFAAAVEDPAEPYVAQGFYLPQLRRLEAAVGRDRLHVVLMEDDLERDPLGTFAGVCEFLGLPRDPVPQAVGQRFNAHFAYRPMRLWRWLVRHRVLERAPDRLARHVAVGLMRDETEPAPMPQQARERLTDLYAPYKAELAEYLGRDLARWA